MNRWKGVLAYFHEEQGKTLYPSYSTEELFNEDDISENYFTVLAIDELCIARVAGVNTLSDMIDSERVSFATLRELREGGHLQDAITTAIRSALRSVVRHRDYDD